MKRNKIISAGIATVMLFSATAGFASEYSDMPDGWSKEAMTYAVDKGYLNGYDGRIDPQGLTNRAQLAAILSRALRLSETADISVYTDVNTEAWYFDSMSKVVAAGIFMGDGENLRPNDNITREEAMTVIARAYSCTNEADISNFIDSDEISSWAVNAVSALVEAGIISGDGERLYPKNNITREEVAQIIYNCENSDSTVTDTPNNTASPVSTEYPSETAEPTATPTATTRPSSGSSGGGSSRKTYSFNDKITINNADYYYVKGSSSGRYTLNGTTVTASQIGSSGYYYYSETPLEGTLYGTATLDYSDFYSGDVSSTQTYDAVTSATVSKYQIMENMYTDWTEESTDGYRIMGVSNVNVAVDAKDYA